MKEALKLALEVLYENTHYSMHGNPMTHQDERNDDTILVIKEALAQPDAFEHGRQEGMKQERALWELSKLGQEIEAQPVQEPVAIVDANDDGYWADILPDRSVKVGQLLYTAPPQRPWVGLTEVDILAESKHWKNPENFMDGVYWAETTLKEKNT